MPSLRLLSDSQPEYYGFFYATCSAKSFNNGPNITLWSDQHAAHDQRLFLLPCKPDGLFKLSSPYPGISSTQLSSSTQLQTSIVQAGQAMQEPAQQHKR